MASPPTQTQRFSIQSLLTVTTTFAISLALWRLAPFFGGGIVVCCLLFWLGYGMMYASNLIDSRQIDERSTGSKAIGFCGAITLWISILTIVLFLPAAAIEFRNSRIPEYMKPHEDVFE